MMETAQSSRMNETSSTANPLSKESKADVLVASVAQRGKIDLNHNDPERATVTLRAQEIDHFSVVDEDGNKRVLTLKQLTKKWDKIADGDKPRLQVEFTDSNGDDQALILRVDKLIKKGSKLTLDGKLHDEIDSGPGLGLDDMFTAGTSKAFNEAQWEKVDEKLVFRNADITVDTFSTKKLKRIHRGSILADSNSLRSGLQSSALDTKANATAALEASFNPLPIERTLAIGPDGAALVVSLQATPTISGTLTTPESITDVLDKDKYSFEGGLSFLWKGSVSLRTGSEPGQFNLANGTIDALNATIPDPITGIGTLNLTPTLGYDANLTVEGVQSEYTFDISQMISSAITISADGVGIQNGSSPLSPGFQKSGDIPGIDFKSGITPTVSAGWSIEVPTDVPLVGGDVFATVNGTYQNPLSLLINYNLGSTPSASIGSSGTVSFDAGVLTFIGGGLSFSPSQQLYSESSGNLFS